MSYTSRQLVTRSWFLSGIVARNLQGVTGDQVTDGLYLLNALLDFKQVELPLIPYFTYNTDYYTVAGQEKYTIENCAEIQCVTFNLGVVRFAMGNVTNRLYFGSPRVDNVTTLPFNYTFMREKGGGDLYLYFLPQDAYQLKILGKFFLTDVTIDQDISLVYDTSYIEYLRYALARYMCSEYGIEFNPQSEKILMKMERQLMYMQLPDLSMKKSSILTDSPGLTWSFVNLGRGWTP